MRFSIQVDRVQETLSLLHTISPTKVSSGIATPVVVEATDDGFVYFRVVDSETVAKFSVVADVELEGSAIVGLESLYRSVAGFVVRLSDGDGTDVLKFSKGAQMLTITAKAFYGGRTVNQRRSLQVLDCYVPNIVEPPIGVFIGVPYTKFSKSLKKVLYSISMSTDTVSFSGVLFSVFASKMRLVSTNGITLTQSVYGVEAKDTECILVGRFVSRLSVVLSRISPEIEGVSDIGIFVDKNIFWIKYKNMLLGGPVQSGKFPKYRSLLEGNNKKFVIDSSIFLDNISSIVFNSNKDDNFRLTFKFMENEFSVHSPTCSNEGLPLYAGKGSLRIDFNARIIESGVNNLGSDLFVLSYKDRHSPVVLEPYDSDTDVVSIIAPLK